ncbi:MAG: PBP1A family penicillin-binding protein [Lactobacillaceae bacterium]|jgi:penicillin-binding protein 2A|nr:PBP1A family penicillin-binding protein [Lactobacillaceae bacterium]
MKQLWHRYWYFEATRVRPILQRLQIWRWLAVGILAFLAVVSILCTFEAKTTDVGNLKARLRTTTAIYDSSNQKAGAIAGQKGTYVAFSKISPNLVNAVLATEDRNFYHEYGFSITGTARGIITTLYHRLIGSSLTSGGSTITQQLVKNAFLSQEQTATRKVREIFLSVQVEKDYTKHDILAMYLNNAYFGNGAWGIQDASQKYFGVNAADLTIEQGAMLAGMLQSPNGYDPLAHPQAAKTRRDQVLYNMVNAKMLSDTDANNMVKTAVGATEHDVDNSSYNYPSFFDSVIDEAINKYKLKESDIMNNGYKIYTTLNQKDQGNLQADYDDPSLNPIGPDSQAATIVLDANTGGVRAVVGGRGEHVFRGYNRATQMRRQPGSIIKPIVDYGPALSRGFSYDSKLPNKDMSFGADGYSPKNYADYTSADVPMYVALEKSYNIPAVWLLDQMGVSVGYNAGIKAGLPLTSDDKNLAMAIGGLKTGVSPLQMAQAYTSFANNGVMSDAHFITQIVDANGKTIVQAKPSQKRLWSKKVANEMTKMMLGVYTYGTGVAADPYGYTVAGKTGTTEASGDEASYNAATDSWAVAYTPDIVSVTWTGYDKSDADHTIPVALGSTAGPLVKTSLEQIIPNTAETSFNVKSVEQIKAAADSGASAGSDGVTQNASDIANQIKKGASQAEDVIKKGASKVWSGLKDILGN